MEPTKIRILSKQTFLIVALFKFALLSFAGNGMPVISKHNANSDGPKIIGQVIRAEVNVLPGNIENCNGQTVKFTFTAKIEVDGPCTVKYRWLRNDNAIDTYAPRILTFTSAGIQTVNTTWEIGQINYNGWQAVEVTSPNSVISNKALFTIGCPKKPSLSCCENNPWKQTLGAECLIESFKNLVNGAGICIGHPGLNFPSVSYAMPENCYSTMTTPGIVTFTSFYARGRDDREFRVIWASLAASFSYYGVCAPDPIVYHLGGGTENHVFGAKLIRQRDYRAASSPINYLTAPAVAITDILAIEGAYVESATGYIASTDPGNYNNQYSSKGIVLKVRLRSTGAEELCYLINNYDTAGTVRWKETNVCGSDDNVQQSISFKSK